MPVYMDVVATLRANQFKNSGRVAAGQVLQISSTGRYVVVVQEIVRGVNPPQGEFATLEDAKGALLGFWAECDEKLTTTPYWTDGERWSNRSS